MSSPEEVAETVARVERAVRLMAESWGKGRMSDDVMAEVLSILDARSVGT